VSKLPVVSGAECVKALGKVGFVVYRQRGSHLTMVAKSQPAKPQSLITKNSIAGLCARSFDKQV